MNEKRLPSIGAIVHFMAGDADVPALITQVGYQTPIPPTDTTISPHMYIPDAQALLVWPAMQQPYWMTARYDATYAPNTWHWPDDHAPPSVPPTYLGIGQIVHLLQPAGVHLPAIVCRMALDRSVDLFVLDSRAPGRTFTLFAIPENQPGDTPHTWHDARGVTTMPAEHETTDPIEPGELAEPSPPAFVGAMVHYLATVDGEHMPAIVCTLPANKEIDLFVINGASALATFVYRVEESPDASKADSWHWPEGV